MALAFNLHDLCRVWLCRFAGSVAAELEENYKKFLAGIGPANHSTDLAERISTTGNELKANNAHTGTKYTVHFDMMEQENAKTGFRRKLLRDIEKSESVFIDIEETAFRYFTVL